MHKLTSSTYQIKIYFIKLCQQIEDDHTLWKLTLTYSILRNLSGGQVFENEGIVILVIVDGEVLTDTKQLLISSQFSLLTT